MIDGQKPYELLTNLRHCYGCGVCSAVCPVSIIRFTPDDEGFYRPGVAEGEKCIRCGKCSEACSYLSDGIGNEPRVEAFSAWSADSEVREKCSSGGIAYEIAKYGIGEGAAFCGVKYDMPSHRAVHFVTAEGNMLNASRGSKYMQSDSADGFRQILESSAGRKIVTGAPCQIASFRKHIRGGPAEDKYLLVDFFCHGTPSLILWDRYLEEKGLAANGADSITFRNKKKGWHESLAITALKGDREIYYSPFSKGDLFYKFFLGNHVLNLPCYTCPFRMSRSAADVRVGDRWGYKYSDNSGGVSSVFVFTEKARRMLGEIEGLVLVREAPSESAGGQIKGEIPVPPARDKVLSALSRGRKLGYIYKMIILPARVKRMPGKAVKIMKTKITGWAKG